MIENFINSKLESDSHVAELFVCFIKKIKSFNESRSFKTIKFTVLLIRSGCIKLKMNNQVYEFGEQDLILIPMNTNCSILSVDELLQIHVMAFSWDYVVRENLITQEKIFFYFLNSISSTNITLETNDFKLMLWHFKLLQLKTENAEYFINDKELREHSITLFLHEIQMIFTKYQNKGMIFCKTRKELLVSQFLNHINIYCKEHHSVEFFANILCITPAHLNKIVKKVINRNAKDLICEGLIGKAKKLLDNPELTIVEIADELEFGSASSFSTFFKKRTSISPSDYRSQKVK